MTTGLELTFGETAGESLVPTEWKRREILGAHKQKDGKNWVGIHVPVGRAYPDEVCVGGWVGDAPQIPQ